VLRAAAYGGLALSARVPSAGLVRHGLEASPTAVSTAGILWQADPAVATVYFTMDDWYGREMVEAALDIAAEERIRMTFFPIGRTVSPNADLVRRAAREGHDLENHTWDHQRLDLGHCPVARIPWEIDQQYRAIRSILGPSYRQHFLRPPGGFGIFGRVNPYLVSSARDAGLRIAMWNVDSQAWRRGLRGDPAAVNAALAAVLPGLAPGAIVLQHAIPSDVLALRTEIRIARERGLRIGTLSEGILGIRPSVADPVPPAARPTLGNPDS
jgi:peptidoglycan/xylan/chitin deacetylase (PgdA/CDA1 family)